jgi:hypothetical protein
MKLFNLPLLISLTLCSCSTFNNEDNRDYSLDP